MNIAYDNQADAMYIKLKDGNFGSNKEVSEGVILDISDSGDLLGIEILDASTRFNLTKDIGQITFEWPLGLPKRFVKEKLAA